MKINLNNLILALGVFLIAVAGLILGRIFFPVIKEEIKYSFSPQAPNLAVATREEAERKKDEKSDTGIIVPADEEFGIVIPKIPIFIRGRLPRGWHTPKVRLCPMKMEISLSLRIPERICWRPIVIMPFFICFPNWKSAMKCIFFIKAKNIDFRWKRKRTREWGKFLIWKKILPKIS